MNVFVMLTRARAAMERLQRRRVGRYALIGVSTLVIAVGVALMVVTFRPGAAPDPMQDDLASVIDYLASQDFADRDSRSREAYMEGFSRRYTGMSESDRRELERLWREAEMSRSARRKLEQSFALGLARQVVHQYAALPPDQREAYLDRLAMATAAVGIGRKEVDPVLEGKQTPERTLGDPQRFVRDLNRFKRDYVDATDPTERAVMSEVLGGLVERLGDRGQGKR